mmetsp:Transcript_71499/g.201944  ORF Transcript_71499/g.201944 Transcript_71499/m.201944 type:complete len:253 (+) Transcript_71499:692-1450(+)
MGGVAQLRARRQSLAHTAQRRAHLFRRQYQLPLRDTRPSLRVARYHLAHGYDLPIRGRHRRAPRLREMARGAGRRRSRHSPRPTRRIFLPRPGPCAENGIFGRDNSGRDRDEWPFPGHRGFHQGCFRLRADSGPRRQPAPCRPHDLRDGSLWLGWRAPARLKRATGLRLRGRCAGAVRPHEHGLDWHDGRWAAHPGLGDPYCLSQSLDGHDADLGGQHGAVRTGWPGGLRQEYDHPPRLLPASQHFYRDAQL